jgi:uncharacterized protein
VTEKVVLFDTSAIVALLSDEEGAGIVERYLEAGRSEQVEIICSFASMAELYAATMRRSDKQKATHYHALVKSWPMRWVDSDETLCVAAGALKATHKLSFADAFIAATAIHCDAVLVHKDPEFEPLAGIIRLRALPCKSAARRV